MTRPRIWKDQNPSLRPWRASHPDNPSLWRLCATWREAMEFVNEKLENPFPLELEGADPEPVTVSYIFPYVFIYDGNDGHTITLAPDHWRPLANALTLLADKENIK